MTPTGYEWVDRRMCQRGDVRLFQPHLQAVDRVAVIEVVRTPRRTVPLEGVTGEEAVAPPGVEVCYEDVVYQVSSPTVGSLLGEEVVHLPVLLPRSSVVYPLPRGHPR